MLKFLFTMIETPKFIEICDWTSAMCSRIIHWFFFFIVKLVGTIVDLIQLIFYMFAGITVDERVDAGIVLDSTGERTNILEYFVLNDQVTKIYVRLCLVAVVLIIIFTIFRIIKQDYFDKTGPRSKGPIFRNVCVSCVTLILIPVIFYVLINASGALAKIVQSSMLSNSNQLLGTKLFFATIAWEEVPVGGIDKTQLIYLINQLASNSTTPTSLGTVYEINILYRFEPNFTFVLSGNYDYLKFNETMAGLDNASKLRNYLVGDGYQTLIEGKTGEELLFKNNESIFNLNFMWYGYIIAIGSITSFLYKLVINIIQRIFFMLAHYIVAPAVVSRYVLDDGQSYKDWLQKTIKQGMRVVSSVFLLSLYVICVELILQINFTDTIESAAGSYFSSGKTDPNAIVYSSNNLISTINMPGANYNVNNSLLLIVTIGDILLKAILIIAASGSMLDLDEHVSKYLYADRSIDKDSQIGKEVGVATKTVISVVAPAAGTVINRMKSIISGGSKARGDDVPKPPGKDVNGINPPPGLPTTPPSGGGGESRGTPETITSPISEGLDTLGGSDSPETPRPPESGSVDTLGGSGSSQTRGTDTSGSRESEESRGPRNNSVETPGKGKEGGFIKKAAKATGTVLKTAAKTTTALAVGAAALTGAAVVGAIAPSALDLFTKKREEAKKRKKDAEEKAKHEKE